MYAPRIPRTTVVRKLLRLARHPIPTFTQYGREYGANFLLHVGGERITHFTTDAEVARHVLQRNHRNYEKSEIQTDQMGRYLGFGLLTNSGNDWLRQRRLIQPGFHRKRLAALTTEMQSVITEECQQAAEQPSIDLFRFTRQLAFDIIVRALFTDGFGERETRRLHSILDKLQAYIIYPIRLPMLRRPLRWAGLERKHLALARESRQLVQRHIDRRKLRSTCDPAPNDLLQMLLDSRYEDTGEPMEDRQLVDEILILFAAGYETTANALAWTVWLLLRHPTEHERLRTSEEPGYLTQVIEESMRLYPPAWITDRVALGPDTANGFTIDKGVTLGLFIYGIHHSPQYYDEPEAFRPDRMHPDAKQQRHPFSYLPFGGGPRLCIGQHFAMLEMQLALRHLVDHYTVEAVGELPVPEPKPYVTLHQDRPVRVRLRPRTPG
ncbi:Putative cytochrome P450 137 [Neolewinella maritima]|uniref:Cytochrome P450 137 n=1 Tax=Neolewinella maritima TaxID=1383882 RepID=A0ABN8F791_9BACT|nr:cytochrome P450 [Neolewinella maritima]CAH1000972.1 Putative cytochrome P450 137 [Neolewinella maritima]